MAPLTERKRFAAGTTGWTASDLDDPVIEAVWERRRYEIVEGVLARMPPAHYDSSVALSRLTEVLLPAVRVNDPEVLCRNPRPNM